jgi:hypothetical protein
VKRLTRPILKVMGYIGAAVATLGVCALLAPSVSRLLVRPHSLRAGLPMSKPPLTRIDPEIALAELDRLDPSTTAAIDRATMLVGAGMANFWPSADRADAEIECGLAENPDFWIKMRWAELIGDGSPESSDLRRAERADWRTALRLGVGFCSQQALVLVGYLREHRIEAEVMRLGGHVIAVATTPDGPRVLDADYGVVLPMALSEAERSPELVRTHYLAAGYTAQQVEFVVAMYEPEGNAAYRSNLIPIAEVSVSAMSMIGGGLLLVCAAATALRQRSPLADSAADPQR